MNNTVIIGGKEFVVSGWGEYEIIRRDIEDKPYTSYYTNKKFIYPMDVIESVLNQKKENLLGIIKIFLNYLIEEEFQFSSLIDFEDYYRLPALTSEYVEEFITSNAFFDKHSITEFNDYLKAYSEILDLNETIQPIPNLLPNIPNKYAYVYDSDEMKNLEKGLIDYLSGLEMCQGILASNCNKIVEKMKKHFNKRAEAENLIEDIINIETEIEIETETDTKIEVETDTKIVEKMKKHFNKRTETDTKTEIEIDTKTEIEIDTKTEIEVDTNTEIEIDTKTKIEVETDTKIEIETDTKTEVETDTKTEEDCYYLVEKIKFYPILLNVHHYTTDHDANLMDNFIHNHLIDINEFTVNNSTTF
jgi:hypothetical protein